MRASLKDRTVVLVAPRRFVETNVRGGTCLAQLFM